MKKKNVVGEWVFGDSGFFVFLPNRSACDVRNRFHVSHKWINFFLKLSTIYRLRFATWSTKLAFWQIFLGYWQKFAQWLSLVTSRNLSWMFLETYIFEVWYKKISWRLPWYASCRHTAKITFSEETSQNIPTSCDLTIFL